MEQRSPFLRIPLFVTSLIAALIATSASAQHTLVRKDGSQLPGEVKGLSGGSIEYVSPKSPNELKHIACNELAAVVDGSLIVRNAPCVEPMAPKSVDCKRNCDALIDNNMRVTKGSISVWMDDRYVVKTRNGEVNLPRSDIIGVIAPGYVEFNLPADRLQKMLADPVVVSAINNTGACAMEASAPVAYSPKWVANKFKDGMERASASKPAKPKSGPSAAEAAVAHMDTMQRGLSPVLDFEHFKNVAMEKTKRLQTYIGQISDKTLPGYTKDKAVVQAVSLFEREDNLVHISNVKTTQEKVYTVLSYLSTHLRHLKYDRVDLQWADLNYASDFELQPDSSYQAVISLQQRFVGEIDGKPYYSDVTNKNITVTLRTYERVTMGRTEKLWDVYLGDIGVTATKAG